MNKDDPWQQRASTHLESGELAQANFCMAHHVKLHPRNYRLFTRFKIMRALGAFQMAQAVMDVLCPIEKASSAHPALVLARGQLCFNQRDYKGAEGLYRISCDRIVGKGDEHGQLARSTSWIFLGSSVVRQGRLLEAIEIYRQATELPIQEGNDPDEAWENIGYAYRALGQFEAARSAFAQALAVCPDADCREQLADVKAAIELENDLDKLESACDDASRFYAESQMAQALVCAHHNAKIQPDSQYSISHYARVLIQLRRFDDAELQIQKLQTDGVAEVDAESTTLRAELAACRGDLDDAIRLYDQVIQSLPNAVYLRIDLGRCLVMQFRIMEAYQSFEKASDLIEDGYFGDADEAFTERGHILRMIGHYEDAARCYQQALQVKPDDREYQLWFHDAQAAAELARETAASGE